MTLRRADLDLDAEIRGRLLEVVADESDRLARIVNDLLLASQLDSGQLHVAVERCDPRPSSPARSSRPPACTCPERIDALARGAEAAARGRRRPAATSTRCSSNLVDNAVKYSPDGGPVEVAAEGARRLRPLLRERRGLGIPPSERRRVFEKFYRLDPNMTRGIGGTGLGLYICRELVRRLDGRIWVEPNGDRNDTRGSTFFVEIPAAKRTAETKAAEKTAA